MSAFLYTAGKSFAAFSLLLLCVLSLQAQQKTKIILQSSERSRIVTKTDITYLRKPTFRQDNAILTCDSAVFYTAKNYFEAFDNVHINQADTINIYSDRLTYDGNAKLAHLTSNVRLVDKTSVLTTNILDYDMVPKIGTYVDGGKIVNKDATITSKNGYYFANSRDAYFRYNVLVVTEQSTIKSDTLRYNTFSNWAYFYGPTNIKEKDGNLYTENGAYNTKTTYAYFGKKNLYTSGSRSLKGDSLYYDGIAGYGKAVRNITFRDTTDKMVMRGQLAFYYKKDQRTLVTKNAYAGMGTNDSMMVKDVKQPDSLWLGADTLETQMVLQKSLKLIKGPAIKKDNELGEEVRDDKAAAKGKAVAKPGAAGQQPGGNPAAAKNPPGKAAAPKKGGKDDQPPLPGVGKDSLKTDSLQKKAVIIPKNADSLLKRANGKALDSTVVPKKNKRAITADSSKNDSLKTSADAKKTVAKGAVKQLGLKKPAAKDSLPVNPLDTITTRSIKAYHHVNVFKSNMQAKADSLFYTSADSTLRWYRNPIIWSEGTQQTGDTIYLQLRNKKLNSIQVIQNAFSVNVDTDSAKFNQIKGKMITGFFKEGKLNSMYVDGNAESVYFTKTEDKKSYDKMNQTISSRIKVLFKNGELDDVVPIKNVEGATTPVADLKEDVILTGFIWKPEIRPRSKRDVTNPKVAAKAKTPAKTSKTGTKTPVKSGAKPAVKGALPAAGKVNTGKVPAGTVTTTTDKIPAGIVSPGKVPAGTIKQLKDAADSLNLQDKIPAKVIDTVKKALPGLMKKADSLSKQTSPLKMQ